MILHEFKLVYVKHSNVRVWVNTSEVVNIYWMLTEEVSIAPQCDEIADDNNNFSDVNAAFGRNHTDP